MKTYRFKVNVPNPGKSAASVVLRLEPAKKNALSWLKHKEVDTPLKVDNYGISLEPCADKGKREVKIKLKPFTSVDVHVVVNAPAKPGVAAFHLIDTRKGKEAGGVLIVCTNPPYVEPAGKIVPSPNACPAVLAKKLYTIRPGSNPAAASSQTPMKVGQNLTLVAEITNTTSKGGLKDTQVYLEHLGTSGAQFTPGTWNAGTLMIGDVFYATWDIRLGAAHEGTFDASIVVASQEKKATRLPSGFTIKG
jgi:hypothetical protein